MLLCVWTSTQNFEDNGEFTEGCRGQSDGEIHVDSPCWPIAVAYSMQATKLLCDSLSHVWIPTRCSHGIAQIGSHPSFPESQHDGRSICLSRPVKFIALIPCFCFVLSQWKEHFKVDDYHSRFLWPALCGFGQHNRNVHDILRHATSHYLLDVSFVRC